MSHSLTRTFELNRQELNEAVKAYIKRRWNYESARMIFTYYEVDSTYDPVAVKVTVREQP